MKKIHPEDEGGSHGGLPVRSATKVDEEEKEKEFSVHFFVKEKRQAPMEGAA